jgi:hypothetical protein
MSPTRIKPFIFLLLGWLIPGLGHFFQKRILKGTVFFCGILILLVLGILMGGGFTELYDLQPLTLLAFFGSIGNGALYFFLKLIGLGAGNIKAFTYSYGMAYMTVAGFLNYLIALNAYHIAKVKKDV